MPAGTLTCPVCGKTGTDKGEAGTMGVTIVLNIGLDPENCAGCRKELAKAGYASPLEVDVTRGTITPIPVAEVEDDAQQDALASE